MDVLNLSKSELLFMIKRYYESYCKGQAISVKVSAVQKDGIEPVSDNGLVTDYKFSVENAFFVKGYLEDKGALHMFRKYLTREELMDILKNSLGEECLAVEGIQLLNEVRPSLTEKDKFVAKFRGANLSVKLKEKTLVRK